MCYSNLSAKSLTEVLHIGLESFSFPPSMRKGILHLGLLKVEQLHYGMKTYHRLLKNLNQKLHIDGAEENIIVNGIFTSHFWKQALVRTELVLVYLTFKNLSLHFKSKYLARVYGIFR